VYANGSARNTSMRNRIFFLVIVTIASHSAGLLAQPHALEFERISLEQGLSQSVVTCILQDRKGFMWFGTMDGLNKYDGYGFTVYKHDAQDDNSLSDNSITALYEDRFGTLWIGTRDGLNRFDRMTECFTHYKHDAANPNSLGHNQVRAIYIDHAGTIWIGTSGGLNKLIFAKNNGQAQSAQFSYYKHDPSNPTVWALT